MEVGTELSAQIKKAIKAKLMEMQCYVDDELPDYIMVMIANKKSTEQMTDDLKIFLGDGSAPFCTWLSEVLHRLETVGTTEDQKPKVETDEKKMSSSNDGAKKNEDDLSPTSRNVKESKEKPKKTKEEKSRRSDERHSDTLKTRDADRSRNRRSASIERSRGQRGEKKLPKQRKEEINEKDRRERSRSPIVIRSLHTERRSSTSPVAFRAAVSPSPEVNRSTATLRSEHGKIPIEEGLKDVSDSDDENKTVEGKPRVVVQSRLSPRHSSARLDESRRRVSVRDRLGPAPAKKTGVVAPLRHEPIRGPERSRSPQRTDDSVHIRKRLGHVKSRPTTSEMSMLGGIFSKALQDVTLLTDPYGQRSTVDNLRLDASKTIVRADAEYDPLKPLINPKATMLSIPRVTLTNEAALLDELREAAKRSQRHKQRHRSPSTASDDSVHSSRRRRHSSSSVDYRKSRSAKRVVLSDGAMSSEDEEVEGKKATKFVVSLKGGSKAVLSARRVETPTVSPNAAVGEEDEVSEGVADDDVILERCRFWPLCKLGPQCPYVHPSKMCQKFPTCSFGDACLFIHPQCRFGAMCFNKKCVYSHPNAHRRPATAPPAKVAPPPPATPAETPCKFGKTCSNTKCPFLHPKIQKECAFGVTCKRKNSGCRYIHGVPVSKFRWVKRPELASKFSDCAQT